MELRSEADKYEVLKKVTNLRRLGLNNETFKRTAITTDMSYKQREAEKLLREELRERRQAGEKNIKIRKGRIVKEGDGGGRGQE